MSRAGPGPRCMVETSAVVMPAARGRKHVCCECGASYKSAYRGRHPLCSACQCVKDKLQTSSHSTSLVKVPVDVLLRAEHVELQADCGRSFSSDTSHSIPESAESVLSAGSAGAYYVEHLKANHRVLKAELEAARALQATLEASIREHMAKLEANSLQSEGLCVSNSIRVAVHCTLEARQRPRHAVEQEVRTRLGCMGQVTGKLFKHYTPGSRGRVNAVVFASVLTAMDANAALQMFNHLHQPAFHAKVAHPHIPRGGRGNHPHLPKPGGVFNPKNHATIRRQQQKHSNRKKR